MMNETISHRSSVSLETKLSMIKKVEEGGVLKKKDIAKQFGVSTNVLSHAIRNKEAIFKSIEKKGLCTKRKRLRTCVFQDIEDAMLKWLIDTRNKNLPISAKLMKQKAREFAEAFGHTNFKTSPGWLYKFKQRHGIVQNTFCGDFNEDIEFDGQTKNNPQSDAEDIVCTFLYNDDEELTGEGELIIAKEAPSRLGKASSALETFRSYLEMKSDVPTKVFGALNILEDFIEGEKFKEISQTKI